MSQHPSDVDMSWQQNNDGSPQKSWFGRNWLWFLPTVILLPILCCCGGGGALMWFGIGKIFELPPYKDSLVVMRQDAAVEQALGKPIQAPEELGSFFTMLQGGGQFNVETVNSQMTFDAAVPVSGPNGTGTLTIVAESSDGGITWTYTTQEVLIDSTGQVIDLLPPGSGSGAGDASDAVDQAVDVLDDALNDNDSP